MPDITIRRNERAVFRPLEEGSGGVLLDLDTGEYRRLNTTGALIWELIADGVTRDDVVAGIRDRVEQPPADLEGQVDAFLAALAERGLISVDQAGGD